MISRRTVLRLATGALALPVVTPRSPAWAAAEPALKPNAPGDQSAAFQTALERATAAGRPLTLAPGTYEIGAIRLPDGARIVGEPRLTRLKAAADQPVIVAERLRRAALVGLDIDGADRPMGGALAAVTAARVEDLAIEDCRILRSSRSALYLEACGGRIERNQLAAASDYGLLSRDSTGLVIRGNRVEECGDGGILVHRSNPGHDGSMVAENRVARIRARSGGTGQVGNGINLYRADDVRIADNDVEDCALSAIRCNAASNVQILGNRCLRSGEVAIYAEFAFQGAVIANNIVDGATIGISVVNFNEGGRLAVISGNLVRNLSTRIPYPVDKPLAGIGIAVEADTTVTGNTIEGAPMCGLLLGWGPYLRDVAVTGNVVRDAGVGVAVSVVEGGGPATIADNIFHGVKGGGVVGYRWHDATTGDLALGASEWKQLTVERNRVVR